MSEVAPPTPQDQSESIQPIAKGAEVKKPEGDPATKERQMSSRTMENLEKSDQAAFIKKLMITYLAEHLMKDPVQRAAFMDKIRTQKVTVGQIVEGMVETAVQNNPALLRRFEKREITAAQIAEGVIDQMFASALVHAKSTEFPESQRKERIAQLQAAIVALRNAAAAAKLER